ncbi:MAG: 2-amino-4-hydroxy-6-hydroxymethyldihydropteridine diphosphokinase [Planctomycetaceae bacterium]
MSPAEPNRAFLALGSNIRPEHYLPAAVHELKKLGTLVAISNVYQSAPVGDENQADFLNGAVLLKTKLSAESLCREDIPRIEQTLNRVRDPGNVNAARTIDIDLVLFNRDVFQVDHRQIPDPDILTRDFLAIPLAELDPDYLHPTEQKPLKDIAASFRSGEFSPGLTFREDVRLG